MNRYIFASLLLLSFCASVLGDAVSYGEEQKTTFTLQKEYNFFESLYKPKVLFSKQAETYFRKTFINPPPEYVSFHTIQSMKEGNYEDWLKFWSDASRLSIAKVDSINENKKNRIDEWNLLFSDEKEISLYSQIQVGKYQYSYALVIYQISDSKTNTTNYIHFGFILDRNGVWKLSEEVKQHPVFKHYVSKNIGKYE